MNLITVTDILFVYFYSFVPLVTNELMNQWANEQ